MKNVKLDARIKYRHATTEILEIVEYKGKLKYNPKQKPNKVSFVQNDNHGGRTELKDKSFLW